MHHQKWSHDGIEGQKFFLVPCVARVDTGRKSGRRIPWQKPKLDKLDAYLYGPHAKLSPRFARLVRDINSHNPAMSRPGYIHKGAADSIGAQLSNLDPASADLAAHEAQMLENGIYGRFGARSKLWATIYSSRVRNGAIRHVQHEGVHSRNEMFDRAHHRFKLRPRPIYFSLNGLRSICLSLSSPTSSSHRLFVMPLPN